MIAEIMSVLAWIALFLELAGIGLVLVALRYRTGDAPRVGSLNPKHWRPLWKTRHWYRPPGFRLTVAGWSLFATGLVIFALIWL